MPHHQTTNHARQQAAETLEDSCSMKLTHESKQGHNNCDIRVEVLRQLDHQAIQTARTVSRLVLGDLVHDMKYRFSIRRFYTVRVYHIRNGQKRLYFHDIILGSC